MEHFIFETFQFSHLSTIEARHQSVIYASYCIYLIAIPAATVSMNCCPLVIAIAIVCVVHIGYNGLATSMLKSVAKGYISLIICDHVP